MQVQSCGRMLHVLLAYETDDAAQEGKSATKSRVANSYATESGAEMVVGCMEVEVDEQLSKQALLLGCDCALAPAEGPGGCAGTQRGRQFRVEFKLLPCAQQVIRLEVRRRDLRSVCGEHCSGDLNLSLLVRNGPDNVVRWSARPQALREGCSAPSKSSRTPGGTVLWTAVSSCPESTLFRGALLHVWFFAWFATRLAVGDLRHRDVGYEDWVLHRV